MKKLFLASASIICLGSAPALAQNTTCSDRPLSDSSNACANTRFVQNAVVASVNFCPLADKTGILDSTAAIQACLTGSNNVYLRFGNYKISAQLVGHDNLTFGGDPGTVVQQTTRGARGFYGSGLTNVEINDLILFGEGTFCGNVGQAITAACPSGVWTGDGGINGFNGRAIQMDNATNFRLNRIITQNWGTAGIALYGGTGFFFTDVQIEGTNNYTTPITSQANFQYGFLFVDHAGFGAVNNIVVNGYNISGTAQGALLSNEGGATVNKSRQLNNGIIHNITGQHSVYGSTGNYAINGLTCTNIANACVKNQISVGGYDPYNFSAIGIVADTLGSNMFEMTILGGTGLHNVKLQGVGSNITGRGLSTSGPVTDLTYDIQVKDTTGEVVFITGDGPKDFDGTIQSLRSGQDCILVTATNADRIRFHHPVCRNPSTLAPGRYGLLVSSASANVTVEDGVFVDAGSNMLNGINNGTAGSTIKIFDSIAITGATGTCISATGAISALPIWVTLSCTGGNYTGAANIARGALGDTSVPFTNLTMGGSTSGTLNLRPAAVSGTSDIRFPSGTTDFSATGGTSQVVRQSSAGATLTVGQLACSDLTGAGSGCSAGAGITALTGDVTASGSGSVAATIPAASVALTKLATENGNTIVANATSGVASPTAISIGSCSGNANALQWVLNSGFSCNISITAASMPVSGLTSAGTGVLTALGVNVGTAGSFVVNGGALGTPSSGTATNLGGTAASLTAGTATNAVNVGVTDDNATNATMNLAWFTSNTGNLPSKTSSSKFVVNPSTGTLSATTFNGAGTSLTGTGASFTAGSANALAASSILTTMDARGTWTTGTSWTLPAHTWAGTVSGGGNQLNNTILGAVTPLAATVTTLGSGAHTITSASATALTVGPNGATNPVLLIDASTASAATGIQIVSKAAGGGLNITTTSSGTNEDILFNAKGSGVTYFASASTGTADFNLGGGNANFRHDVTIVGQGFIPNIASDTATTDNTVCMQTGGTGKLLKGTGTLGICLGTSSAKFKHDIAPMGASLAEIVRLAPKNFFYNKGYGDDGARQQYGFIAEDVVKVLPGVTAPDAKGKPQSVDMLAMVPILVNAVKQLKADNDNLRMDVLALQAKSKANAR